jgi:hypothetical protein
LEAGAVLYFDAYGNNLVTGYRAIVNNPGDCNIWQIGAIDGVVQSDTGDTCGDFGGCL